LVLSQISKDFENFVYFRQDLQDKNRQKTAG